jgi:hypothetical protein
MKRSLPSMARVTIVVCLLVLPFAGAARADAQDDAIAKITQLNKEAIGAYQQKKFDDARKLLKQALDLAASVGLDNHPIAARTHIHLGAVIITGFQQKDLGLKQFKKAIEIQTDINLTPSIATPELNDAFAEAKKGGGASSGPATPPSGTPPPGGKTPDGDAADLSHEAITESKQGSAISITVKVNSELQFDKMVLAYRPDGATEFLGREMKQESEGTYEAEIPDTATGGSVVAYYIEAQDADGALIATRGTVEAPLVVHLAGVGARRHDVEETGDDEDDDEPDSRFYVGLMAGTGFGWATGDGDTNADVTINPAGMALAGVGHVSPELGYWLTNSLMLSAQLRYQYITGTTDIHIPGGRVYHTANYAFAAFVRATWRYGEDKFHPFFSLALGGGRIRHVVSFKTQLPKQCGANHDQECVDTIGAGPVLLGPGAGIMYDITDSAAIVLQANSVVGFPTFTVNLDANLGVAVSF